MRCAKKKPMGRHKFTDSIRTSPLETKGSETTGTLASPNSCQSDWKHAQKHAITESIDR